jgi:hypothetical protein
MTNKNPKRPPGTFRAPQSNGSSADVAPKRGGLLDGLLTPRARVATSMPKIPTSLWRGLIAVVSSPVLVLAVPLILVVEWAAAVAIGFQGPFSVMGSALAVPPVGTLFDGGLASALFGTQPGLMGLVLQLVFVALRAVILGLLTAAVVQKLDEDRVTRAAAPRGVRIIPTTLAVGVTDLFVLTISSIPAQILGLGIGFLLQVGILVAALYLLVFAPVIAVSEGRGMPESLGKAIRAGRMPGAGNLAFAAIYMIPAIVITFLPGVPGKLVGVNPTAGAWAFAIVVNLLQVVFLATFAFRYLSIADEVPEAPVREPRGRRRR